MSTPYFADPDTREPRECDHAERVAMGQSSDMMYPTFTRAEMEAADLMEDFDELNYSDPFADDVPAGIVDGRSDP